MENSLPGPQPYTSTPQLPFKTPQIESNRDHKATNRGTSGGLGILPKLCKDVGPKPQNVAQVAIVLHIFGALVVIEPSTTPSMHSPLQNKDETRFE